jgi:hypothetical protein
MLGSAHATTLPPVLALLAVRIVAGVMLGAPASSLRLWCGGQGEAPVLVRAADGPAIAAVAATNRFLHRVRAGRFSVSVRAAGHGCLRTAC